MYFWEIDDEKVVVSVEVVFDLYVIVLSWLEEYIGIFYLFEKFDFVLFLIFQYGGMEYVGFIFY